MSEEQQQASPAVMDEDQLREELLMATQALSDMRDRVAETKEVWQEKLQELKEANAQLLDLQAQATARVGELEEYVRKLGLQLYAITKERQIVPGVAAKEETVLHIKHEGEALAWAERTQLAWIPGALDKRKLLQIAKVQDLPFAEVRKEPKVVIATNLRQAILDSEVG